MTQALNTGLGICRLEATTQVVAPLSWITEGREQQYAATILAAVHDHNRKARPGEFIALDFPGATFRREFAGKPGTQARLIGSHAALEQILDSDRLKQFRRPSVKHATDLISAFEPLEEGYCLVRSQKTAKIQPGGIRRQIARAKRRGHGIEHISALEAKLHKALSMTAEERRVANKAPREACIFLGDKPFFVARRKVSGAGGHAEVTTYGMSSATAPVVFGRWIEDKDAQIGNAAHVSILAGLFDEEFA